MALNDFQIVQHFNLREFQCRCCGQVKIGHDLVFTMEELRKKLNLPVRVVSGYRCPNYNVVVGGAKDSYHIEGRASDIAAATDLNTICRAAKELGLRGIGKYPDENYVHIDNREKECYWVKHKNKPYKYMSFEEMIKSK